MELRERGIVDLEITGFSKKGNGLGSFWKGKVSLVVEVPFAMPGDYVRARLRRRRGSHYDGILLEVLRSSPDRIPSRCSHFSLCGGCRWQSSPYEKQLERKQEIVNRAFSELLTPEVLCLPIIGCSEEWSYRNKMEFSFSNDLSGKCFLGLIQASGKGKVCDLRECHLTRDWMVETLSVVREWWQKAGISAYRLKSDQGSLRTLALREGFRSQDRLVMLTVSGNPDYVLSQPQIDDFVRVLQENVSPGGGGVLSVFLRIQQISKGVPTSFFEMKLCGNGGIREELHVKLSETQPPSSFQFQVNPSSFFQPNTFQAEKLYTAAFEMVGLQDVDLFYDLYCGTGTIGICASKRVKKVVGIDISPESTINARANAQLNDCGNVTIVTGAVRHVLSQMKGESKETKCVVAADPPRPGLDEIALKNIGELGAEKVLYISCNAESQAKNIRELSAYGYRLKAIRAVDQFPQTAHVENIAVLEK